MSVRCWIICLLSAVLLSATLSRAGESRRKQQVHEVGTTKYGPPILSNIPILGDLFCTVAQQCETHHLLVLVTPRIHGKAEEKEKKSIEPACDRATICPNGDMEDVRTLILPPVRDGEMVRSEEPSEARILRALPPTMRVLGICEESRDNIQIVTEGLVDKIDPPRFFPLVGRAQLHRCRWKCTVYYQDTIALRYPFPLQYSRVCSQVVYVDSDHLHIVPEKASGEIEQGLDLSGKWEGTWYTHDGSKGYAEFSESRLFLRSESAQEKLPIDKVTDEGRGKCRLQLAGVTYFGIYKHDGGRLLLCIREDRFQRRPTSFVGDNGQDLFTLHRIATEGGCVERLPHPTH